MSESIKILDELTHDDERYFNGADDSYFIKEYDTQWGKFYKINIRPTPGSPFCNSFLELPDIHISLENAVTAARNRLIMHVGEINKIGEELGLFVHARLKKDE